MSSKTQTLVKAFPAEVAAAFNETAQEFGLEGPEFARIVVLSATYAGGGVAYRIMLDTREHSVETRATTHDGKITLIANIKQVASASGVAEQVGRISRSASSLHALRGSLNGQASCLKLIHPVLSGPDGLAVMRSAGARELWPDDDT